MAKFQRIGPVWRKPRPKPWKQKKAATIWANERQWIEEFDPIYSTAIEFISEDGYVFMVEGSDIAAPQYLILEG